MDEKLVAARKRLETALAEVKDAMRELTIAEGKDPESKCSICEGTGKDPLHDIMGSDTDVCDKCNGKGTVENTFPLVVTGIEYEKTQAIQPPLFNRNVKWVSVRPCEDKFQKKTYLGILLGDMALGVSVRLKKDGNLLVGMGMHNPAIYIPEMHEIVFGCGSWWAAIKSPDDLRKITDSDIENVWYVRALNDLNAGVAKTENPDKP